MNHTIYVINNPILSRLLEAELQDSIVLSPGLIELMKDESIRHSDTLVVDLNDIDISDDELQYLDSLEIPVRLFILGHGVLVILKDRLELFLSVNRKGSHYARVLDGDTYTGMNGIQLLQSELASLSLPRHIPFSPPSIADSSVPSNLSVPSNSSDSPHSPPGENDPEDLVNDLVRYIVEIKLMETELDSCREKMKITSGFIDMFSHDIGLPLTSLKSNIEHLLDGDYGVLDEDQQKIMITIQANVEKINNMRKEALMLNKFDSGSYSLQKSLTSIHSLLQEVMFHILPMADRKDQTIELDSPHFSANIDKVKIRHVIENLLSNAVKYTPPNGAIEITAEKGSNNFRIRVLDNGIGVPEGSEEYIFERFSRLHKNMANGTGLGLSIVKTIVDMHGGNIWYEHRPGGGSIFVVELPRK